MTSGKWHISTVISFATYVGAETLCNSLLLIQSATSLSILCPKNLLEIFWYAESFLRYDDIALTVESSASLSWMSWNVFCLSSADWMINLVFVHELSIDDIKVFARLHQITLPSPITFNKNFKNANCSPHRNL